MTIEQQVADLTNKVAALLSAVTVSKSYLDAASKAAIAGVTAQGAMVPTSGKSPLGNAQGVFDPAWLNKDLPLQVTKIVLTESVNVVASGLIEYEVANFALTYGIPGIAKAIIKMGYPQAGDGTRIVSGGDPWTLHQGYLAFEHGIGDGKYAESARFSEAGRLLLGTTIDNGTDVLQTNGSISIKSPNGQLTQLIVAGLSTRPVLDFALLAGDGTQFSAPASVLYAGKNGNTGRGITTPGTVNTSGNDYAEYILKSDSCGDIAKGQIVGITADNTLTQSWADAVMFSIKSTAPSFVGGDTWSSNMPPRPEPTAGLEPAIPFYRQGFKGEDGIDVAAETPDEWRQRMAAYEASKRTYLAAVQKDEEALAAFEVELEIERQKVDRIAIAGRVPVNVMDARPGDYIVPVQDGAGIGGIAVADADLTFAQYKQAVGKVIRILSDGRAYVMVRVA